MIEKISRVSKFLTELSYMAMVTFGIKGTLFYYTAWLPMSKIKNTQIANIEAILVVAFLPWVLFTIAGIAYLHFTPNGGF